MIQTLEDMVGIFFSHGLGLKDCDVLIHYLCNLLPEFELEYKTSINASTNQNLAILEEGLNQRLIQDSLTKNFLEIHPTASSFKGILDKTIKYAVRCMEGSFAYAKDKWDKLHDTPYFKIGEQVIFSTTKSNNIKGFKKLKDSFAGNFVIMALHGENAVELELSG
ncbi:hypothetical protein O181_088109 [Austropuccinia psidii MF-1]|uniref:Uncharacterized protein n=1 Tax=Austropuccinia psidii MF-1 TaxID=1389203 RepID=A0A9Q3IR16_9BASI|nr:hypothetical protein [Austropuccinia psidii MF-1]